MHRHHAQGAPRPLRLALDLRLAAFHPRKEPGQTGGVLFFIGPRADQRSVDPVLRLRAEAGDQPGAPRVARQQTVDQIIGTQEV